MSVVAPDMGAWIEMREQITIGAETKSRSRHGSVD